MYTIPSRVGRGKQPQPIHQSQEFIKFSLLFVLSYFFSLQAFYPANKEASVEYGDIVAARCVFTGEGRTSNTYIG